MRIAKVSLSQFTHPPTGPPPRLSPSPAAHTHWNEISHITARVSHLSFASSPSLPCPGPRHPALPFAVIAAVRARSFGRACPCHFSSLPGRSFTFVAGFRNLDTVCCLVRAHRVCCPRRLRSHRIVHSLSWPATVCEKKKNPRTDGDCASGKKVPPTYLPIAVVDGQPPLETDDTRVEDVGPVQGKIEKRCHRSAPFSVAVGVAGCVARAWPIRKCRRRRRCRCRCRCCRRRRGGLAGCKRSQANKLPWSTIERARPGTKSSLGLSLSDLRASSLTLTFPTSPRHHRLPRAASHSIHSFS